MTRIALALLVVALVGCSGNNETSNNTNSNNNSTPTNNTTTPTNNTTTPTNNTTTPTNNTTTPTNNTTNNVDPMVVIENADCYEFSDDVDSPLAIDGVFETTSQTWRRPISDTDTCPADGLTPADKALTPYIAFRFCNADTVDHLYDFELLGQAGAGGEPLLADAYIVIYQGTELPTDHTQCLAINDDIEGAIDAGDSEILGLNVPAGETVIVVATTFTFDPNDGTGTGGYILIATNAD